jgi:serine/threonine protein kinase
MDHTTKDQPTLRQDPLVGMVLEGRYNLMSLLGRGGMGQVYLAEQMTTGRKVAVKTMLALNMDEDDQLVKFFRHEIKALAKLNHPNIAQVYDASTTGNLFYIAIEYVEGESLRDRLNRCGRLGVEEAVHILREACSGLHAAHQRDIIHRDIKPDNIMLTSDLDGSPHAKILDFGIAIVAEISAMENDTGAGEFAGTVAYMSPEQAQSSKLSPQSDIYSLGVVGYEILTGTNPFATSRSPFQVAMNHVTLTPPRMSHSVPDIPAFIEEAIMKALEKSPGDRFATAREFAGALETASTNS